MRFIILNWTDDYDLLDIWAIREEQGDDIKDVLLEDRILIFDTEFKAAKYADTNLNGNWKVVKID